MRGLFGRVVGWARASFGYGVDDSGGSPPVPALLPPGVVLTTELVSAVLLDAELAPPLTLTTELAPAVLMDTEISGSTS